MKRAKRVAWGLYAGFCGIVALGLGCEQQRRPSRYLVPEGYVGWVRVEFGVQGAPALPIEDGFYLVRFSPSGLLKTSSDIEYGIARDEYYYFSRAKRLRLRETGWSEGGMIWGGNISGPPHSNIPALAKVSWKAAEEFFVGTEVQLKEAEFQSLKPSAQEKEFYDFGESCGMQDGSRGVDEFAEDLSAPRTPMVGGGKAQDYLAKRAGGVSDTEATRRERPQNPQMAVAYKLYHLLVAAGSHPQYRYVHAFKKGYGIAQLKLRIKRHAAVSGAATPP
jgi:hypothetical protein